MIYGPWVLLELALHSYHLAYSPVGMEWRSQRKEAHPQALERAGFLSAFLTTKLRVACALYTDFTLEPLLVRRPSWSFPFVQPEQSVNVFRTPMAT